MEIRIKKESSEGLMKLADFEWKQNNRKSLVRLLYFVLFYLLFFLIYGVWDSVRLNTVVNFFMGVVVCLSFIFLLIIVGILRRKKQIFSHFKFQGARFDNFKSVTEIVINENIVTYRNFEKYLEFKWSSFYHYQYIDDILKLNANMEGTFGIIVDRKDIDKEQFEWLLRLVESKITNKKIFGQ